MNAIVEYYDKYGKLPRIPFIQCSGIEDEAYVQMIENALLQDREVEEDDYKIFFPQDKEALY